MNIRPSFKSICLCADELQLDRAEREAGGWLLFRFEYLQLGPDRSSPSSHQKMSSYDQKKGRNKTDSYISYFELSSCYNCDAVQCSFEVSRKSVKYPSLFEQGSFLSNC